jgi:hypothetical protein
MFINKIYAKHVLLIKKYFTKEKQRLRPAVRVLLYYYFNKYLPLKFRTLLKIMNKNRFIHSLTYHGCIFITLYYNWHL